VSASEIAEVAFCPRSLYLRKQGVERSRVANERLSKGTELHRLAASDHVKYKRQSNNNCYVATYLYGSEHEITNLLRKYRDQRLLNSFIGKIFVKSYYRISPLLIRYFGRYRWFNILSMFLVNKFVKYIVKRGL
jgi:hypothetical protein